MRYEARALARRLFAGQWRALATDALPTSAPARRHASAADAAAPRAKTQLAPGAVFTRTRQFSAAEVAAFVGMTGDSNPIHVDSAAAAAHGLRAPILPGLLSASLFPAIIGSHFPGAVYASQTLKFKAPALVGDELIATLTVERCSGRRVSFNTVCRRRAGGSPTSSGSGRAGGCKEEGEVVVEGTALAIILPC
eukprot:scaffold7.g3467.t1